MEEPQRKRHRPEGEEEQPLAPRVAVAVAVARRCRLRQRHHHLQNGGLEQETEMTDATVEQQGESKRRREHPEVPQAVDSSSSSSESPTVTEMGLVDVSTMLCDTSEAAKRDTVTETPVAGCRRS